MKVGNLVAILAAAAILAALYAWMKPAPAPPAPADASPAARVFTLTVAQGRVVSGPQAIRVTQGDAVVIRVNSDQADELHLHGYDLEFALRAGEPGALAFTADKAGRFDLELHHARLGLAALEVQPR